MIDIQWYVNKVQEIADNKLLDAKHISKEVGICELTWRRLRSQDNTTPVARKTLRKLRDYIEEWQNR